MVQTLFWVTYIALWMLMALIIAAVFFLYRYHGSLFLNSSEGRTNQGPSVSEPLAGIRVWDTGGAPVLMGELSTSSQFVFFASTKCGPCVKARDALGAFAERHKAGLETIVICQGSDQQVQAFAGDMPKHIRIVSDPKWEIGTKLRISSTPFALATNEKGTITAKGMPDTEEAFQWFSNRLN
jgi:hypothetical protein